MQNLCFSPPAHVQAPCISGFKNYKETIDSSGRAVLVEVENPYEGLSADSFSLQSQLDAGVPLQHLSPISSDSLSSVDKNNAAAEKFIKNLNPKND